MITGLNKPCYIKNPITESFCQSTKGHVSWICPGPEICMVVRVATQKRWWNDCLRSFTFSSAVSGVNSTSFMPFVIILIPGSEFRRIICYYNFRSMLLVQSCLGFKCLMTALLFFKLIIYEQNRKGLTKNEILFIINIIRHDDCYIIKNV